MAIFLVSLSSLLNEITDSTGKDQVAKQKQSMYTMGFLSVCVGALMFVVIGLFKTQ